MSDKGSAVVEAQTDEVDDIGGDVAAALKELGGSETQETSIVLDKTGGDRPRDEAGKFAKALQDDKPEKRETLTLPEKAKPEGVIADPAQKLGVPAPADASSVLPTPTAPVIKPPEGLKGELKAKFGELSPEWQAEWQRREAEAHKALTSQDEERQFGRRINQLAAPYLATIKAEGATVDKAFENYLNTAHVLRSGSPYMKAQALHAIAQQFNVDLNLPLQGAQSSPEIAEMRQQLSETRSELQALREQRQQQEEQSINSVISGFENAPGHEHFQSVKVHMGALMDAGAAKDMEEAYQMAIWAHPDLRSTLVANQQKAAEDKRKADLQAEADRAKNAAVSVTGGPGSARPQSVNRYGSDNIEDDVRAAASEVRGRV